MELGLRVPQVLLWLDLWKVMLVKEAARKNFPRLALGSHLEHYFL